MVGVPELTTFLRTMLYYTVSIKGIYVEQGSELEVADQELHDDLNAALIAAVGKVLYIIFDLKLDGIMYDDAILCKV